MPTQILPELNYLYALLLDFLYNSWIFVRDGGIPLPVGIIGGWRWGVWILRRLIGHFYRPIVPSGYMTTTTIVTPVYNEDPDVFRAALRSWAANHPTEIIAVVDHTDTRCMEQFREFEAECDPQIKLTMMVTHTPGKRPALADGILVASSEIVFLVDSDTIWDKNVLEVAIAPFIDPAVGGVTTRQNVLSPNSTAQRLFDVYLDIRYIDEIRFLTAFGDAVTCLSGRTAVYRRCAALSAIEDLTDETFLGKQVISGDDKALTLAVQSRGWKVRYQENARVFTPGADKLKVFLKQRLRWARNSWRADIKALSSRWAWRKPILTFHLLDRLFQPLTTLIAPIYLCFAIYHHKWQAISILIVWWFISRCIKILPHIRRRFANIVILPWYILFNYWSAVLKIYAFFTMNQQGWITRWNRGRSAMLGPLRSLPSYAATAATIGLVVLFIQSLHSAPAQAVSPVAATASPAVAAPVATDANRLCILQGAYQGQCSAYAVLGASTWWEKYSQSVFTSLQGVIQQLLPLAHTPPSTANVCVLQGDYQGNCATYAITVTQSQPIMPQWQTVLMSIFSDWGVSREPTTVR
ncbi:MAG: glycosyltransferase [Caldilineaceae bacterium]